MPSKPDFIPWYDYMFAFIKMITWLKLLQGTDPVLYWAEILHETGISEAGKCKNWVSTRNALIQLLVGSHELFFGRCCVTLHCHQHLWSKQIICTLFELGRDFMGWGRKDFAVGWATCGTIPQGWGFPRKTNRSVVDLSKNAAKRERQRGLTALRAFLN